MTETNVCSTEGCKANLPRRLGVHSWWCLNWTPVDALLKPLVYNGGMYPKEEA